MFRAGFEQHPNGCTGVCSGQRRAMAHKGNPHSSSGCRRITHVLGTGRGLLCLKHWLLAGKVYVFSQSLNKHTDAGWVPAVGLGDHSM